MCDVAKMGCGVAKMGRVIAKLGCDVAKWDVGHLSEVWRSKVLAGRRIGWGFESRPGSLGIQWGTLR